MNTKEFFCPDCNKKFTGNKELGYCPYCGVQIRTTSKGSKEITIQGENADDVKKVVDSALKEFDDRNEINISAPWGGRQQIMQSNIGYFKDSSVQESFIKERSRVHLEYIKENEKTKRISLIASAILLALGLIIIIFGPAEKQTLSSWIGASLIVLAAGTAGYKRIWAKTKVMEIKADQDRE